MYVHPSFFSQHPAIDHLLLFPSSSVRHGVISYPAAEADLEYLRVGFPQHRPRRSGRREVKWGESADRDGGAYSPSRRFPFRRGTTAWVNMLIEILGNRLYGATR